MPNWNNFFKEVVDEDGTHRLETPPVNDGNRFNVNRDIAWLTAHGFREWADEEIEAWRLDHPEPETAAPDMTAFRAACTTFKTACSAIGTAIGKADFKGGFDEMEAFQKSPVFGTIEGLQLAMAWSAANEYAKYEGQKLGYGQPQWWYKCWEAE